jgi:hypothetical protein
MSGQVYVAIAQVIADLAKKGVPKRQRNDADGYAFRGIDDVYNALSRALAKHRLCILPQMLDRSVTERRGAGGEVLNHVTVRAAFTFVAAEDGSSHVVEIYGEALDSSDKATAKAMSAAYKYACFQTFCIPTEGDNDADAKTHRPRSGAVVVAIAAPDQGWVQWAADIQGLVGSCESVMAIETVQATYRRELAGLSRAEPKLYAKLGRAVRAKRKALEPARKAA